MSCNSRRHLLLGWSLVLVDSDVLQESTATNEGVETPATEGSRLL